MKLQLVLVSALAALVATADTDYPIADGVRTANEAKVAAAGGKAPLAVAVVEALSPIKRTPDLYPEDADFTGELKFVAAQGEYEAGSLQLFASDDIAKCTVEVEGIPADWLDIRVVKVWYQMGTAWVGYHEDSTRRIPTPELMLKDEDLVRVDHVEREQFVRMDAKDGKAACYEWVSFQGRMADFSPNVGNIDISRIHDAKTLQPFALQKGAFKQLWVTFRAPESTKAGIYAGKLVFKAEGKVLAEKGVRARVLPFKLPYHAETFHNPDKDFRVRISTKDDVLSYVTCDAYARDLAAHNAVDVGIPQLTGCTDEEAKAVVERCRANGLNAKLVRLPGCNMTTSYPPEKDDFRYYDYLDRCELYTNDVARAKRLCGEDAKDVTGQVFMTMGKFIGRYAIPAVEALVDTLKGDEKTGAQIIAKALQAPVRQIAENAGVDGSVVFEKIRYSGKNGYGFNAYTEEYMDMVENGIVDPTKVTRSALENAASIAACVLTTESLVTDKPDPAADAAMAAAAAGGMGGMY